MIVWNFECGIIVNCVFNNSYNNSCQQPKFVELIKNKVKLFSRNDILLLVLYCKFDKSQSMFLILLLIDCLKLWMWHYCKSRLFNSYNNACQKPKFVEQIKNNVKFLSMNDILLFSACSLFKIWQMAINILNFIDH